ncbi:MAG: hypothetical protein Q9159_006434 [Coniocarpon cinnabarinum]
MAAPPIQHLPTELIQQVFDILLEEPGTELGYSPRILEPTWRRAKLRELPLEYLRVCFVIARVSKTWLRYIRAVLEKRCFTEFDRTGSQELAAWATSLQYGSEWRPGIGKVEWILWVKMMGRLGEVYRRLGEVERGSGLGGGGLSYGQVTFWR